MSAVVENKDRTLPFSKLNRFWSVEIETKASSSPFHTYQMMPCTNGDFYVETRGPSDPVAGLMYL